MRSPLIAYYSCFNFILWIYFSDSGSADSSIAQVLHSSKPEGWMANQEVVLYWSGGKDCATALYDLRTEARYQGYEVSSLLTTLTDSYDRISGHGVRNSVLDRQAHCLGLSVHKTYIPPDASMDQYDSVIESALLEHRARGTKVAATGDIFVEKRRMSTLKSLGLRACCPLLRKQSVEHFKRIVSLGFQAYVVCVDATVLDESFVSCLVGRRAAKSASADSRSVWRKRGIPYFCLQWPDVSVTSSGAARGSGVSRGLLVLRFGS